MHIFTYLLHAKILVCNRHTLKSLVKNENETTI